MDVASHQPAGFCPYCDYATDPGKCTECGREVSAERLVKSPKVQRLKRYARRTCKAIVIIAVLGGIGYGVYHETRPHRIVRYYSTDYLLERTTFLTFLHASWADVELSRRYDEGKLNKHQATLLVKHRMIDESLPVSIRSPHPYTDLIELGGVWPKCELPFGPECGVGWYPYPYSRLKKDYDYVIYVDNEPKLRISTDDYPREQILATVRGLVPGEYCIKLECTTSFTRYESQYYKKRAIPIPPVIPQPFSTESECQLIINEAGPEAFVNARFDDGSLFQNWLEQWFDRKGQFACINIFINNAPPPLAGQFQILPVGTDDDPICSFRIPHDREHIEHMVDKYLDEALHYRARYIPSAAIAFDAGYPDYFNGVIEWYNIKIENGMPVFGTPDVIRPYDADEFDLESMLSKNAE